MGGGWLPCWRDCSINKAEAGGKDLAKDGKGEEGRVEVQYVQVGLTRKVRGEQD